jgi:hypothetical protein
MMSLKVFVVPPAQGVSECTKHTPVTSRKGGFKKQGCRIKKERSVESGYVYPGTKSGLLLLVYRPTNKETRDYCNSSVCYAFAANANSSKQRHPLYAISIGCPGKDKIFLDICQKHQVLSPIGLGN